eukprot:1335505-Amorphochlora_amoeboformis.AAC.2
MHRASQQANEAPKYGPIRIIGNYGLNEHYDSIKRAKSSMQLQCELQAEVERKWKSHLGEDF